MSAPSLSVFHEGDELKAFPEHELVYRYIVQHSPLPWALLRDMTGMPATNTLEAVTDLADADLVAITTAGLVAYGGAA